MAFIIIKDQRIELEPFINTVFFDELFKDLLTPDEHSYFAQISNCIEICKAFELQELEATFTNQLNYFRPIKQRDRLFYYLDHVDYKNARSALLNVLQTRGVPSVLIPIINLYI